MPGPPEWRYIAEAADLDAAIQRMRASGLAHWVGDLPGAPDLSTIEQTLMRSVVQLVRDLKRWLPPGWDGVRRWLDDGVGLVYVRALLRPTRLELPAGVDPALQEAAAADPADRRSILAKTRYARYLGDGVPTMDRWLGAFPAALPQTRGREAYVLARLQKLAADHLGSLGEVRRQWQRTDDPAALDADIQWRLREELERNLRDLLGGYPFHAGFFLVCALLELLQFERCRALLMARAYGWEATGVL
ncbi:MAG: hypothetical protein WB783_18970 [Arenicellales bacterium]